jgi:predicted SnoaL-like aldol condensation-catalyzing enzyme
MENKSNKTIVLECYRKIIRDLDLDVIDIYVSDAYIQHSPTVRDGKAGLAEMLGFLKKLPKSQFKSPSPIIRVVAEDDLVAVHLDISFMGKKMAVVDLYRLENGKLVEHWDAGEEQLNEKDNAITMTNGTTVIEDSADPAKSKRLVSEFYSRAFNGDPVKVMDFFTPGFIEHNLSAGLINSFGAETQVKKLIGEGNFVVAHCEYKGIGKSSAVFDIFKLEEDKIAEHWSVRQQVPEVMAHQNGMF